MPLTDTKLRNLTPSGKRFELPDRDGLVLRVSQKGIMTWTVSLRVFGAGTQHGKRGRRLAGSKRRLSIGRYPETTLAEARAKVNAMKQLARKGRQPGSPKSTNGIAPRSVGELIDRYVQDHLKRNLRSAANVEKLLRRHVDSRWGGRDLETLRRADLVALLEEVRLPHLVGVRSPTGEERTIQRGGPSAAAEVRKWVQALFGFAVQGDLLATNPFENVKNRDKQRTRDRVLTMEELGAVWRWAEATPYPWGPFVQLLILTGARRNEWANAEAAWLAADGRRLEIPGANYKGGRAQVLPLSTQAREIVEGLPTPDLGPYIFSSCRGLHPISGFSKIKRQLDVVTLIEGKPLAHWTLHDLRRSMATHMERIGIQPHIIEMCLGHTLRGVAAVYRRYEYLPERADALQQWADELIRMSGGQASSHVPVSQPDLVGTGRRLNCPTRRLRTGLA